MATLAGGVQVATVGLTASENEFITGVINNQITGGGPVQVQSVSVTQEQVTTTAITPSTTPGEEGGGLLIGNVRTNEVSTVQVSSTVSTVIGGTSVAFVDTSTVTKAGSVTNLVVDNTTANVMWRRNDR